MGVNYEKGVIYCEFTKTSAHAGEYEFFLHILSLLLEMKFINNGDFMNGNCSLIDCSSSLRSS